MKHNLKTTLLLCLVLVAALATSAFTASTPQDDKVVFGGSYILGAGETLDGNLIVLGGAATLEPGSTVTGDTVLVGGTLDSNGTINGTLAIVGGTGYLGDTAIIDRDVVSIGGSLSRAPKSQIKGEVMNYSEAPFSLTIPGLPGEQFIPVVPVYESTSLMWRAISLLGAVILASALGMLIALLWAKPTQRVAQAITINPIGTAGFGCLTMIVAPGLLVLVAITIILSPLSLLGFFLLAAAVIFGWTAISLEIGNRLAKLSKLSWSAPVAAGIGGLAFNFVIFGLAMVPCFGWAAVSLVMLFALGGVLITRFGTHDYPETPASHQMSAKPNGSVAPYASTITSQPTPFYPEVTKPAASRPAPVVKAPVAKKTRPAAGTKKPVVTKSKSKPVTKNTTRTGKTK
jgi:hypothetical protein